MSGPTGAQGVAVFSPRPDGQVTVSGVDGSTPVTLVFAYMPDGYRVLSAVALYGDAVTTGWTPVPQTLGY